MFGRCIRCRTEIRLVPVKEKDGHAVRSACACGTGTKLAGPFATHEKAEAEAQAYPTRLALEVAQAIW